MRIFNALLVIIVAALLFMIPLDQAIYDYRTKLRTDEFSYTTGAGVTTANVTLIKEVYDDDTSTIDISSDDSSDNAVYSSYDTGTRALIIAQMAESTTRNISVSYDVDSLEGSDAINTIMDIIPFIWMLLIIAFPAAAIFAIFTGRV